MNLALLAIILQVISWISIALWQLHKHVYQKGREVGSHSAKFKQLVEDIQTTNESISTNNVLQNERYDEFRREFEQFRRKIAKELGINGT